MTLILNSTPYRRGGLLLLTRCLKRGGNGLSAHRNEAADCSPQRNRPWKWLLRCFLAWLLSLVIAANGQPATLALSLGQKSPPRPVVVYSPTGMTTNSVIDCILTEDNLNGKVKDIIPAWRFRLDRPHLLFATIRDYYSAVPILLGERLWVVKSVPGYGIEIAPAMMVSSAMTNGLITELDVVKIHPGMPDPVSARRVPTVRCNAPGTFFLSEFIVANHLNNPRLSNPVWSLPLENIAVDKSQIAFDVAFLKNAPIRMIFDHQFDLLRLERNGKELEFDRKVWKGIHEKWRQSISDWRKLNQEAK